jgi:hypothetical protein
LFSQSSFLLGISEITKASIGTEIGTTPEAISCKDICFKSALAKNIDLYDEHDERYVQTMRMDKDTEQLFFNVDPTADETSFTAKMWDNVYVAARLAYRKETPAALGRESWPTWLDFKKFVRGHYTPDSLSEDGMTWNDLSGKGRHATVISGEPLEKITFEHANGKMKATEIIKGGSSVQVEFPEELFPPPVTLLHTKTSLKCTTNCVDFSTEVAYEQSQDEFL